VIVDDRLFKSNKIDYRALFIEALKRQEIKVGGSFASKKRPAKLPPRDAYMKMKQIAVVMSPPFAETLKLSLKPGHNRWADTFLLLIALKNGKKTVKDGIDVERGFLNRLGVNLKGISINDGEGRARENLLSPRATIFLLRAMAQRPDFMVYRDALPRSARGKVFAVAGINVAQDLLIRHFTPASNGLAGYITTFSGKQLAFVVYVNNVNLNNIDDIVSSNKELAKIAEIIYKAAR
jgi:D-alanyl-D-alanine carboxypeptidase